MATQYKWTDPATGQETAQGMGTPTPITPDIPQGATKISNPKSLKSLTEKDIFRSGKDIYQLPKIDPVLNVEQSSPDVPAPEEINDVSSFMAGLDTSNKGTEAILKEINKQTTSEKEIPEIRRRQDELTKQVVGVQEKALPTAEQFGLTENTKNLQAIMPQIASIKAQFDNAEIAQEGRKGLAGSIYGRQALIQRQRAVELAGLSAVAQAYQGNIELATQTAQQMVDMELAPIQTQIDNQKWQLEQVQDQLTRDESRKVDSLNLVLEERQRLLDEEKEKKNNISNLAITAAQNGADQATIEKIMKAGDYMTAIKLSSQFLQGKWTESEITDANGNPLLYNENTGEYKTSVGTSTSDIFFTDANGDSWNIAGWATDQTKPNQMNTIAKQIGKLTDENIDEKVAEFTPALTSDMIKEASAMSGVSWEAIMTMVVQEAQGGTSNVAKKNNNFGGLTFNNQEWIKPYGGEKGTERPTAEGGNYIKFPTKQQGLNAMAALMAQYGKVESGVNTTITNQVEDLVSLVESGRLTDKEALAQVDKSQREILTKELAKIEVKQIISEYSKERANRIVSSVDELIDKVSPYTVGWGSLVKGVPTTSAKNFSAQLDTLKANIAFNELTAMREASKTGGALGQVSDNEGRLLAASLGSLDQAQSTEEFTKQLNKIKDSIIRWQAAANTFMEEEGVSTVNLSDLDFKF